MKTAYEAEHIEARLHTARQNVCDAIDFLRSKATGADLLAHAQMTEELLDDLEVEFHNTHVQALSSRITDQIFSRDAGGKRDKR